MTDAAPPLILASTSATRARLLADAGVQVELVHSGVDERAAKSASHDPAELAKGLADAKAIAVSHLRHGLVIGADQTLDLEGERLDKPLDIEDARRQLLAMRGRRHRLHTAVAVAQNGDVIWRTLDSAKLWVRPFSDAFLDAYLAREGQAILGCAGCYRLEGCGVQLFDRIVGDYFTVLGLPLSPLLAFLRSHDVLPS